jgi:hypothetical protein
VKVGAIGEQIVNPLAVDHAGPLRPEKVRQRELQKQIAQWSWIQNA